MFLVNPFIYGGLTGYLVDDYSPVVAYSTQKISSTITNVVKLRRDSDNAESSFSATDLTDGTATTWTGANNGFVVRWYNQGTGGGTYDVTQVTASSQPILIVSGSVNLMNSIPSVKFQGTNDYLVKTATPFGQNDLSLFGVSSNAVASDALQFLALSNTTDKTLRVAHDTRTTPNRNFVIQNSSSTYYLVDLSTARTAVDTLTLLSSFVDSSNNMSGFDNGATGGTDTFTGTWTSDGISIGKVSSAYFTGNVSEVVGFTSDKSADRTDIETNINDRFSIY